MPKCFRRSKSEPLERFRHGWVGRKLREQVQIAFSKWPEVDRRIGHLNDHLIRGYASLRRFNPLLPFGASSSERVVGSLRAGPGRERLHAIAGDVGVRGPSSVDD